MSHQQRHQAVFGMAQLASLFILTTLLEFEIRDRLWVTTHLHLLVPVIHTTLRDYKISPLRPSSFQSSTSLSALPSVVFRGGSCLPFALGLQKFGIPCRPKCAGLEECDSVIVIVGGNNCLVKKLRKILGPFFASFSESACRILPVH